MSLEDIEDVVKKKGTEGHNNGRTKVLVDAEAIGKLKKELNVSSNKKLQLIVDASIFEYLGMSAYAEEKEDEWIDRFKSLEDKDNGKEVKK